MRAIIGKKCPTILTLIIKGSQKSPPHSVQVCTCMEALNCKTFLYKKYIESYYYFSSYLSIFMV